MDCNYKSPSNNESSCITLREISCWIWTKRIKTFTLRQIPVRDDESGPDLSSRTGIPLNVKFVIRLDDESSPDSSSGTGICHSLKVFIHLVQIQPEISLSATWHHRRWRCSRWRYIFFFWISPNYQLTTKFFIKNSQVDFSLHSSFSFLWTKNDKRLSTINIFFSEAEEGASKVYKKHILLVHYFNKAVQHVEHLFIQRFLFIHPMFVFIVQGSLLVVQ